MAVKEDPNITCGFSQNIEWCLKDVFDYLKKAYTCNYMGFIFEQISTKNRIAFSTNDEWTKNFVSYRLIDACPLYTTGINMLESKKNKSIILPWWHVIPQTKAQETVAGVRREHGVGNGLSIAMDFMGYRAMLAMAVDPKNNDFNHLYLNNPKPARYAFYKAINSSISDMRRNGWIDYRVEAALKNYNSTLH